MNDIKANRVLILIAAAALLATVYFFVIVPGMRKKAETDRLQAEADNLSIDAQFKAADLAKRKDDELRKQFMETFEKKKLELLNINRPLGWTNSTDWKMGNYDMQIWKNIRNNEPHLVPSGWTLILNNDHPCRPNRCTVQLVKGHESGQRFYETGAKGATDDSLT